MIFICPFQNKLLMLMTNNPSKYIYYLGRLVLPLSSLVFCSLGIHSLVYQMWLTLGNMNF